MPWIRAALTLRFIALLVVSEFVRTGVVVAFLPLAAASYGLGSAQVGAIVSAHYLMDALAKGPMGVITQRLGLGGALVGSGLAGLALLLTLPLDAAFWLLVLLSAVWGLLYAALWPGVMAVSQQYAAPGREARALSITSLSVAPAILLGALGVGQWMQRAPSQVPPALLAAQVAALLLALSVLGERLRPAPGGPQAHWYSGWKRVAALLPAAFAQTLAPGLLVTLFYPLLAAFGLGLRDLLLPALLGGVTLLLALLLAGRLADQVHPRAVLGPGLLLLALTFWLAGLPGVLPGGLYPLSALLGAGYGAFMAGWNGLVGLTLPPQHRAAAWGIVMATEALGYALGPLLGGAVYAAAGLRVFWLGALVFVLAQLYDWLPGRVLGGRRLGSGK